jgi:nucleotide-binding universal stress UspA family protein
MYSKILVPLDGSELAEQILPHVAALAGCHLSEIVLLRVVNYPTSSMPLSSAELEAGVRDCVECEALDYLKGVAEKYFKGSQLKVEADAITGEGPVVDSILDYTDKNGVELIAMSTHGRTGPARWIIGSVAERVVRAAKVPVLLVRAGYRV